MSVSIFSVNRMYVYFGLAEVTAHSRIVLASLQAIQEDLLNLETGQRGYLITGQEIYLDPYYEGKRRINSDLERFVILTKDNPTQQESFKILRPLIIERIETLDHNLSLRREGNISGVIASVSEGKGLQKMEEIRDRLHKMEDHEGGLLRQRVEHEESGFHIALWSIALADFFSLSFISVNAILIIQAYKLKEAAEKKVREQYRMMNTFIVNAPVAIAMFDSELRFLNVSKTFETAFHRNREDVIGKHLYDIMPDMPERWKEEQKQVLKGLRGYYRDEIIEINGKREYINRTLVPWFENNEIGGMIAYVEFITEEINTQAELRRIHEEIDVLQEQRRLLQIQIRAKLGS